LDLRGRKWLEAGEDCIMRSFINCILSPNIITVVCTRRMTWTGDVACMKSLINY
jgi:hypothetical protein